NRGRYAKRSDPNFRIGERAETQFGTRPQIFDGFADPFELFRESGGIETGRECENRSTTGCTSGAARHNFTQSRKFEEFFGASTHIAKMAEEPARVKDAGRILIGHGGSRTELNKQVLFMFCGRAEFLDHCSKNRVESGGLFMSRSSVVICEHREDEIFSMHRGGVAGNSAHMFERASLGVQMARCGRAFHAIFKSSVLAGYR